MLRFKTSKTFDTSHPESAEDGYPADSGFEFQDVYMSVREIVRELQIYQELSAGPIHSDRECEHVWASTVDPEANRDYYERGIETRYSLHIHAPGRQLRRIYRLARLL